MYVYPFHVHYVEMRRNFNSFFFLLSVIKFYCNVPLAKRTEIFALSVAGQILTRWQFANADRRIIVRASLYFTCEPQPMLFAHNALRAKYADNTNPRIRLRIRG